MFTHHIEAMNAGFHVGVVFTKDYCLFRLTPLEEKWSVHQKKCRDSVAQCLAIVVDFGQVNQVDW